MSFTFVAKVGFDESAHITLPAISKTGYTCRWAKGSSSGTKYSGGSSVEITSNTTFYAKCERVNYSDEPYAFQYDPGDSWYCNYERTHRDGGYFCLSESDVEQFGIIHGGSAVSNTTYCYYCCRESYNGLPYQGQSGGYCQYYVN